jgi:hypothetical protein
MKNIDKYLLLNFREFAIVLFLLSFLLHNIVSGIIGKEEPVFFLLATLIIPAYFFIAMGYTIANYFKKRK